MTTYTITALYNDCEIAYAEAETFEAAREDIAEQIDIVAQCLANGWNDFFGEAQDIILECYCDTGVIDKVTIPYRV